MLQPYATWKPEARNMDETDDFAADLWGEDDIDEALLIEASQQVEAETIDVSKTNTSKYFEF